MQLSSLILLNTYLVDGKKQLLEPRIIKSLADMLATASPGGQFQAAACLWSLSVPSLFPPVVGFDFA